jgi:predicted  nucleic acid-binding Zn-ribbon protein
MTDTPDYFPSRLDRIEQIILGLAERQAHTQEQIDITQVQLDNLALRQANTQIQLSELKQEVGELTDNVTRVLGRSAILDDVLLELRDSHEAHQRNFEEHQRTTNAALQSLEAILLQLTRNHS